jgi:hypothetical protein
MTDKTYDLGDFDGVNAGMPEEGRWEYPTVGYNATNGVIYFGDEQVTELKGVTMLAMRQCKEIADAAGVTHRYPLKTRKADMVDGDFTARLQVIMAVGGELYTFGARSWTARAAFANPSGGAYKDDNFDAGLWVQVIEHVKDVQKATGKTAPPLCWSVDLAVSKKQITVGTGKNTSKSYPLVKTSEFAFVGPEQAKVHADLYEAEALNEWVAEWGKRATEQPDVATDDEQPDQFIPAVKEDEIPW